MYICDDCQGIQFVWDRDGDVTCTGCGLVKMERYIDDRCDDITRVEAMFEEDTYKHHQVRKYMTEIDDDMKNFASDLYDIYMCKSIRTSTMDKKKAIMANCLYYSGVRNRRSHTIENIARMFQIELKSIWDCKLEVFETWKDEPFYKDICQEDDDGSLRRMIYNMGYENPMKINKMANHIMSLLRDESMLDKVKKGKMNASIIYASCNAIGIHIDKHKYCRDMNISMATLKKHEGVIQYCLQKNVSFN